MNSLLETVDNITLDKQAEPEVVPDTITETKGFWTSTVHTVNPFLSQVFEEDLRYTGEGNVDEYWRSDNDEEFNQWTPKERQATTYARNLDEARVMVNRHTERERSMKELEGYNGAVQFAASLPVALTSWTTALPVSSVYKMTKALGTVKGSLVASGAIGAGTGYMTGIAEQATGYDPDADVGLYTAAGAILGVGMEGLIRGINNTPNKEAIAEAFSKQNLQEGMDTYNSLLGIRDAMQENITTKSKVTQQVDVPTTNKDPEYMEAYNKYLKIPKGVDPGEFIPPTKKVDKEVGTSYKGYDKDKEDLDALNIQLKEKETRIDTAQKEFMDAGYADSLFFKVTPDFMKPAVVAMMDSPNQGVRGLANRIMPSPIALRGANGEYVANPNIPGMVYKEGLKSHSSRFHGGMTTAFSKFKGGNFNEFSRLVMDGMYKAISLQHQGKTLTKITQDDAINEGITSMIKYYKDMGIEGNKVGAYGLKNVDGSKLYAPQMWDFERIAQLSQTDLERIMLDGMSAHNKYLDLDNQLPIEELTIEAKKAVSKLRQLAVDRDSFGTEITKLLEIPMGDRGKRRSINVDPTVVQDILVRDAFDSVGQYHYKQSGQYALNHAFPEIRGLSTKDSLAELKNLWADYTQPFGEVRPKDEQKFNAGLEDLLGTYRLPKNGGSPAWTFAKNMKAYNSLIDGGNFIFNTPGELGGVVLGKGLSALFRTEFSVLKDVASAVFSKDKKLATQTAQEIMDLGLLTDVVHITALSRHADLGENFNVGRLEGGLNWANNEMYKWTGMKSVTAMLEAMNAVGVVGKIRDIGNKTTLADADKAFLARLGFAPKDAKVLVDHQIKGKKGLYQVDLENIPDDFIDKLNAAIIIETEATVPKFNGMYAPDIIANMTGPSAWYRTLALQYMAHPLIATQTMFMRGMVEDKKGLLMATTIGLGAMSSTMYLKEQLAISLGLTNELDAKYDINTDKGMTNLVGDAFGKNSVSGMIPTFIDWATIPWTEEPLLSSSKFRPDDPLSSIQGRTISTVNSILSLGSKVASGEDFDVHDYRNMKSITPGTSMWFIKEYLDGQIKEMR